MAIFDREGQRLIVRVVYDGVERAGKTTNLQQLCGFFTSRRRGELYTPEADDDRTVFFDWLHLDAGLVAGYPLRCQLVTVPGQVALERRRWHLLRAADVVVFVTDSTPEGVEQSRSLLALVNQYLQSSPGEIAPLVVQANKQDLAGAQEPGVVLAALGLPADVPSVGARAHDGVGVRETVVLAIRAAANRAQGLVLARGIDALAGDPETGEALYEAMRRAEPTGRSELAERLAREVPLGVLDAPVVRAEQEPHAEPSAAPEAAEAVAEPPVARHSEPAAPLEFEPPAEPVPAPEQVAAMSEPVPTPRVTGEPLDAAPASAPRARAATLASELHDAPAHEEPARPADPRSSVRGGARASAPPLVLVQAPPADLTAIRQTLAPEPGFPDEEVASGAVWPASAGRDVLRRVPFAAARRRDDLVGQQGASDGSGRSDALVFEVGSWCLKASARRRFADADDARAQLVDVARRKMQLGSLLPEPSVVSLGTAADGSVWLWTIAPWLTTLRALMGRAVEQRDEYDLTSHLALFAKAAVQAATLASRQGVTLDVSPSNFGVVGNRLYYLDDDIGEGVRLPALAHALLQRVEEHLEFPTAVRGYQRALEAEIEQRLGREDVATLGLAAGLAALTPRSAAARDVAAALLAVFPRLL
jgi:hypothetical protein